MLRLEVSKRAFKSSGRNLLCLIMVFVYFELYFLPVLPAFLHSYAFLQIFVLKKKKKKLPLNRISLILIQKLAGLKIMYFRRFPYGMCALMGRKYDCAFSTPLPCSRGVYNILLRSSLKHFSILLLHKTLWHAINYIFTARQSCLSVQSRDMVVCFFASKWLTIAKYSF